MKKYEELHNDFMRLASEKMNNLEVQRDERLRRLNLLGLLMQQRKKMSRVRPHTRLGG